MGQARSVSNPTALEPSVVRDQRLLIGDLVLDTELGTIQSRGLRPLKLSNNEFAIMGLLAQSPGRVVDRIDLMDVVASDGIDPHPSVVDTYVKFLRRQLQAAGSAVTIEKVPDVGFVLRP